MFMEKNHQESILVGNKNEDEKFKTKKKKRERKIIKKKQNKKEPRNRFSLSRKTLRILTL